MTYKRKFIIIQLCVKFEGTHISNLYNADDTALIANSEEEIIQLTNSVNEVGKGMNLRLHVKKTKLLVGGADPDAVHNIEIDGETVQQVIISNILGL